MNRIVRDQLKRTAFAGYKQALRLGVHIIPAHYYAPLPNIIELERQTGIKADTSWKQSPNEARALFHNSCTAELVCGPRDGDGQQLVGGGPRICRCWLPLFHGNRLVRPHLEPLRRRHCRAGLDFGRVPSDSVQFGQFSPRRSRACYAGAFRGCA